MANIDIAPTIYELASIPLPNQVDGHSLVLLLAGTETWREDLLIENWFGTNEDAGYYQAIHTGQHVYVERLCEPPELYELHELQSDPYQLQNLYNQPVYAELRTRLQSHLNQARAAMPARVEINGNRKGKSQKEHSFVAHIQSLSVSQPLTYTWETTEHVSLIHTSGLSDTATFYWESEGPQLITVTVTTPEGILTSKHNLILSKK